MLHYINVVGMESGTLKPHCALPSLSTLNSHVLYLLYYYMLAITKTQVAQANRVNHVSTENSSTSSPPSTPTPVALCTTNRINRASCLVAPYDNSNMADNVTTWKITRSVWVSMYAPLITSYWSHFSLNHLMPSMLHTYTCINVTLLVYNIVL